MTIHKKDDQFWTSDTVRTILASVSFLLITTCVTLMLKTVDTVYDLKINSEVQKVRLENFIRELNSMRADLTALNNQPKGHNP